jgi:hypothetical protein
LNATLRQSIPDFPSLVAEIRRRPGMYCRKHSIRALAGLLSGIELAEDFHEIGRGSRLGTASFDRGRFERWIEQRRNPTRLTANSVTLAEIVAGSDEAGFNLWLQWYDDFALQESPTQP